MSEKLKYGSAADVAQRIREWLGKNGQENTASLLLYEAMQALERAQPAGEAVGWTNNAEANAALLMLDRLDVSADDDVRVDAIAATIRRLAAESKPIGYAEQGNMTAGFTMAVFDAASIPAGTPLYAAPPAAANQAGIPEGWIPATIPPSKDQCVLVASESWRTPRVLEYDTVPYPRFVDRDTGRWYWYPERMNWMPIPAAPHPTESHALGGGD